MALIQRSTPTTQKDFSANAFINNTGSKRKKSSIPSKTFFGTCFHRNENEEIEKIGLIVQRYLKVWDKVPGKNNTDKYLNLFDALHKHHNFSRIDIKHYFHLSTNEHFKEAIPRHIDTTKEKVGSIIRNTPARKKVYENHITSSNNKPSPKPDTKKISTSPQIINIDFSPDVKQYFFIIEGRTPNNLELDAFCQRQPEVIMISDFKRKYKRYPKDSSELIIFKNSGEKNIS